jgi:hypothetical protein
MVILRLEQKTDEQIKPGSEFQPIFLDEIFQGNDELYKNFAKDLYVSRLQRYFSGDLTSEQIDKQFSNKLEKYSDEKITVELSKGLMGKNIKHIIELRSRIKEGSHEKVINHSISIDSIIEKIIDGTNDNPLEQKYKIYLLYREWANWGMQKSKITEGKKKTTKVNIECIIDYVNEQYSLYKNGEKGEFDNIKEKYKADLLAQLTYENNIKNTCYSGIEEFINLSWESKGISLILKLIVENSDLLGEKPLEEGSMITLEAQYQGCF